MCARRQGYLHSILRVMHIWLKDDYMIVRLCVVVLAMSTGFSALLAEIASAAEDRPVAVVHGRLIDGLGGAPTRAARQ